MNAGGESGSLDGFALANQAGERYALPAGLTLPSGGLLLIRFDGTAQIAETTLHAPQTGFLHRETGSLALFTGGDATDEARWSTAGGPSFSLGRGGHIPTLVAGTTLGRPPGSIRRGAVAWTVFDPADATPGAPNPFPAVAGLMPLSGAILHTLTPTLRGTASQPQFAIKFKLLRIARSLRRYSIARLMPQAVACALR